MLKITKRTSVKKVKEIVDFLYKNLTKELSYNMEENEARINKIICPAVNVPRLLYVETLKNAFFREIQNFLQEKKSLDDRTYEKIFYIILCSEKRRKILINITCLDVER